MRAAIDKGLRPTNHTDFVVAPLDQMFVLWTAVNRVSRAGASSGRTSGSRPSRRCRRSPSGRPTSTARRQQGLARARQARRPRHPRRQPADGRPDGDQGHPRRRDDQGRQDDLPGEMTRLSTTKGLSMRSIHARRSPSLPALLALAVACTLPLAAQDDAAALAKQLAKPGSGAHQRAAAAQLRLSGSARTATATSGLLNVQPVVPISIGARSGISSRAPFCRSFRSTTSSPARARSRGSATSCRAPSSRPRRRPRAAGSGASGRSCCCPPAATIC